MMTTDPMLRSAYAYQDAMLREAERARMVAQARAASRHARNVRDEHKNALRWRNRASAAQRSRGHNE